MNTEQAGLLKKTDVAEKLDQMGWGVFLAMIGVIWLLPRVPQGTWLIGTGVLLLLLNVIRVRMGIRWSGVSVLLGALALAGGLADLTGIDVPLFPICLLLAGAALILKPLLSGTGRVES
jgi:hypothetical protein